MDNKIYQEIKAENSVRGMIASRKCSCCGHHEIIIIKEDGEAVPLKPGMKIIGYLIPEKEMK